MSSWTHTASTKWAEDVAMASVVTKESKSLDLPTPVTHSRPAESNFIRTLGSAAHSKGTKLFREIKKTLDAPSPDTVVRASLGDIQQNANANQREIIEDIPAACVAVSEDEIDEIVVDRSWGPSTKTSLKSKAPSESDESSSVDIPTVYSSLPEGTSAPSDRRSRLTILVRKFISCFLDFFNPHFPDKHKEEQYRREHWVHCKRLALWASVFFIGNWTLGAAMIPTPAVLADKLYYYAFAPCTAVPLVFLCAFNVPRDFTKSWQCLIVISTWSWSFYQVLFGFLCGYTGILDLFTCGTKDFSTTFYYTTALQTVALFGLDLKRFPALLGSIIFIVLAAVLIAPEKESWMRNVINFVVFQIFLMYMHYQREMSARHLFELRIELKEQFERTQQAQLNERKAADSKYRLTSYVFHAQVRVPLNTALLAVQNMSAMGSIAKSLELEFTALEGSLNMMSKVLNDVLDFNRMDSGKFESLSKPYAFHQVMRSMFLPLRLATDARKLELIIDLDMNIDEVARRAAYRALGKDSETTERLLKEQPNGESNYGIVVGDETRLRQVVTNLASNACKFTPAGGKLTIRTRLVFPSVTSVSDTEKKPNLDSENTLTTQNIERHNQEQGPTDRIVVRIEISDTGSGIPPQDMIHSKLFSAFNQTEQGRLQGGKGTGLGLALVRLIVKLSGGRLGVRSKVGQGSTFWVELPLGIGEKAMLAAEDIAILSSSTQNLTSKALLQSIESQRRNSVYSVIDTADVASRPTLVSSPSLRSKQALHSLMDQGGSVELNLANYDSHSAVPTRMIGDRSTGSDIPLPYLTREESSRPNPNTSQVKIEHGDDGDTSESQITTGRDTCRPNRIPLPSPNAYPFDPGSSQSNKLFSTSAPSTPFLAQPLSVLVVDDDGLTRTLMRRMLERIGCVVTTAENGSLALDILLGRESDTKDSNLPGDSETNSQHNFDIVFLDNQMPVLGGLKVVARLRDLGRRDFVVGVTGNALVTDQQEYLAAGVDHVLTKPVLERSLRNMLQLADERRKSS